MNNEQLFNRISNDLEDKLHFLDDKPEENLNSTIKALWFKAAGVPLSAFGTQSLSLPELNESQVKYLQQLIQLRIENMPLSYITGRQNFMGIELHSDKRALIPRKETEILGNKALALAKESSDLNKEIFVMDVCCGAGNLGIALAHHIPSAIVFASDISHEAVALTQENIDMLNLNQRVHAEQGDIMSAFEKDEYFEKFDIIVCNPPYIFSSNVPKMDLEISLNEPAVAFDGGMLGIKIIKTLIREAPKYLKKSAFVVFEVGLGQGKMITKMCERTLLYSQIETVLDDSGNIRVIFAQKL